MNSTATASAAPAKTGSQSNHWIVSPRFDAFWFLATPLLCAALILPLRGSFSSQTILVFVMGLSSFGHHLPGFLRAYGDSDLFARFRLRFLLAPIVVYAVFVTFALAEMQGMMLLLMLWSVWHVGMQHFGFLRIYDAKRGIRDALGARLDWVVSIAWFAAIVLWSPTYSHILVERMYASGWTWLTPSLFTGVQNLVGGIAMVSTLIYVGHVGLRLSRGLPVSWIKLGLLVLTLSFLAFVWAGLGDIYLGLATWEIFHDLQYFALTWVYNRQLVDKGLARSSVMRTFFSPRRVALYALVIPLYGSLNLFVLTTEGTNAFAFLMAFVLTSTFLHYYFDGFIWKVGQKRTRVGLSLEESATPAESTGSPHAARPGSSGSLGRSGTAPGTSSAASPWGPRIAHALLFALPIGVIAAAETMGESRDTVDYYAAIAAIVPDDPLAFTNLARAREEAGDPNGAADAYRAALLANAESSVALDGLAVLEHKAGRLRDAEELWKRALAADPIDHVALANYALFLLQVGRVDESARIEARAQKAQSRLAAVLLGAVRASGDTAPAGPNSEQDRATARLSAVHSAIDANASEAAASALAEAVGADPVKLAYARGRLALAEARFDEAIVDLELATTELGDVPAIRETYANALEAAERFGDAADQRIILLEQLKPVPLLLRHALVRALVYADRAPEAVPHLRVLAEGARDPSYDMMLAEILATHSDPAVRNGTEAMKRAARVSTALGPDDPGPLHVWSLAAAEAGDFPRAVELGLQAIDAAVGAGRNDLLPKLQATLREYQAGRPIRSVSTQ